MLASVLFLFSVTSLPQLETVQIGQVLALEPVGSGGRVPIVTNALTAQLVKGEFKEPKEGDTVTAVNGQVRTWTKAEAGQDGSIQNRAFRGGFAFASVESPAERVMMLEAAGQSYVYVNGEPRGGDPYSFGNVRLPVLLHKGKNSFLFNVGRGSLRARLVPPDAPVFIELRDATLPDVIVGESGDLLAAVVVTNATSQAQDVVISAKLDDGEERFAGTAVIAPMMSQKQTFAAFSDGKLQPGKAKLTLQLVTRQGHRAIGGPVSFEIDVKQPWDLHKRTFESSIDGSVQYYAVRPPFQADMRTADSLILSVHGAGVEATGQAAAYGAKSWAWVVAATNRRPYGFDWEDWGRMDAMDVLAHAKALIQPREDRIYLSGHSMGGHGTWILGALYPDQWAAIGPCSGWISFSTYGGGLRYQDPDPIEQVMLRAANVSDTTLLLRNYLQYGVYILHGEADDNVPVTEARKMREYLGAFHKDFDWREEPGAGHWYDNSPEPGASCLDYGPMMDFFARHRRTLAKEARSFEFHTACPQVSAKCYWLSVEQQTVPLAPSVVTATQPVGTQRFEFKTENVSSLMVDVRMSPTPDWEAPIDVLIDGVELKGVKADGGKVWLDRSSGAWVAQSGPALGKDRARGGPFRAAFDHDFVLVYGTKGTPEENAWSYAKARYDAETWWYRGNGRARLVPDTDPLAEGRENDVVLYGNEDTNARIKSLLSEGPVRVDRKRISVGGKELTGDDLAILMARPCNNAEYTYAIVGGTGMPGLRSTDTMPYFVSGVHYPDLFVYDSRIHTLGSKGVLAAGWFGNDWSVERGDVVWR